MAAELAKQRILERLKAVEKLDPPVEYKLTLSDMWSRRLFVALLRRYEIQPFRYKRQRYTTVMARVPRSFVQETLWPEYCELNEALRDHLDDVTTRVVREVIHAESSEAEVRQQGSLAEGD